jgi:hypothetical protein
LPNNPVVFANEDVPVPVNIAPMHPPVGDPQGYSQADVRALLGLMPAALNQLKKQFFKPTETAIKGALKALQRHRVNKITLTPALWEELISEGIVKNNNNNLKILISKLILLF